MSPPRKPTMPTLPCMGPGCKKKTPAHKLDAWYFVAGAEGTPDFCSWSCLRNYADEMAAKEV